MNILLVLPAGERVRVTPENPRVPRRAMLRFSVLPLTIVAALTPREHGVRIVDENVEPLDFEADVDVVGITFMTALAPRAYEIAREFQARGRIVIGGGYHATLCPDEAQQNFDAIVAGDAEGAWPRVLEDIQQGRLGNVYRATVLENGRDAAEPGNLFHTPIPRRELREGTARHYVTINAVQIGRGCQHRCRYCSVTVFHGHRYRHRPLADVLEELRQIPRNFIFVDDNIIADRKYAREPFEAMTPLRKRWVSQCSIEVADDPELLRLMHAAGCCGLFIGVETLDAENLADIDKQFNNSASYREGIRKIRRSGIGIVAGIIVGLDKDKVGVFERTLRFLQEARIDSLQLNILTPLPGTPLFVDMERAGRVIDCDWSHYDYRHAVFQPMHMSAEQLQAGADWLYLQFYRLDRILWRFACGLFSLGWMTALLGLKLGLTYRYDNQREGIVGWNPSRRREFSTRLLRCSPLQNLRVGKQVERPRFFHLNWLSLRRAGPGRRTGPQNFPASTTGPSRRPGPTMESESCLLLKSIFLKAAPMSRKRNCCQPLRAPFTSPSVCRFRASESGSRNSRPRSTWPPASCTPIRRREVGGARDQGSVREFQRVPATE